MKLKLLSLLVAMLTVLAILVSCGGDKPGDNSGNNGNNNGTGDNGGDNGGNTGDSKYAWTSAEILVQLYENSNNNELEPGVRRYYAGEDTSAFEEIDNYVRDRNHAAETTTKVDAKYTYETTYAWGAAVDYIQNTVKSGSSAAPDVFCNFAYDITSCAIRGCFANLYSNTDRSSVKYGAGENYFRFTEDGYVGTSDSYFDAEAGEGYFYDYMQSLAFVNSDGVYDKMYCLASNYCTDLVRAFLVVPVSVDMMNAIALEDSTGDRTNDGKFDIEDFYKLVWDYEWTYDVLATYSNTVYRPTNSSIKETDINDVVGFAAGIGSGLTASGILYTTSVQIINKVEKDGKVTYEYPETNQKLVDLSDALYDLFDANKANGICVVDDAAAKLSGVDDDELRAIRTQFANGTVLFGGIICVGSLEDKVYQDMNEKNGFGIVPVPLYKQDENKSESYLTLVHNLARIVAISATTTEFEQCSAFLNYQSTNSADILDAYYDQKLVAAAGNGAGDNNKLMLNYIRNHVRDCFDKTYEDVISNYMKSQNDEAMSLRWHGILSLAGYKVTGMATKYAELYGTKQGYLDQVLTEWAKLP